MWFEFHPLVRVVIISLVAGVVGTMLGGILGIIVKKPSKMYVGSMLAIGAGAMLGMSLFEMLPHAFEYISYEDYLGHHWGWALMAVMLGVSAGAAAVFGLSVLVNYIRKRRAKKIADCACDKPESILYEGTVAHDADCAVLGEKSPDGVMQTALDASVSANGQQAKQGEAASDTEAASGGSVAEKAIKAKDNEKSPQEKSRLFTLGIVVFLAIVLHDLPEGMAIGAGEHLGIGLLIGVMMLLHNIPEGLAIAVPLKASGTKSWKIIGLCALAGLPALLGGIIGWAMGLNLILAASTLAFASGAMMFVVFKDMLPTAYRYTKGRHALTTLFLILGILLMIVFHAVLH